MCGQGVMTSRCIIQCHQVVLVVELQRGQASTKKVSADEVFKQLASVPQDKAAEAVKKLV